MHQGTVFQITQDIILFFLIIVVSAHRLISLANASVVVDVPLELTTSHCPTRILVVWSTILQRMDLNVCFPVYPQSINTLFMRRKSEYGVYFQIADSVLSSFFPAIRGGDGAWRHSTGVTRGWVVTYGATEPTVSAGIETDYSECVLGKRGEWYPHGNDPS